MAVTTLLKAEERKETGKSLSKAIRKNGQIPCVISVSYTHLTLPTNREV